MEFLSTIFTRRSIRKFTSKNINPQQIEILLQAAMSAPSARNQQPWQFVVITKKEILQAIPNYAPHAAMCTQAPLAIAVCGDLEKETAAGYWVQDCAAATQNILLAAHALNLGAVWTGIYPRKERVEGIQKLLGLPATIIPLSIVPIGYPAEEKEAVSRFNKERIHLDVW